jgi:hypothetical protein
MPACIWNMLVCAAGPLDTGQLLTYLYLLLLPVIVLNLIRLAYPTEFVAKVIIKSAPWHLRGRPHNTRRTRVKRYKIPVRKLQKKVKTYVEQPCGLTSFQRSSPPSRLVVVWSLFSDSSLVNFAPTWPSKASKHQHPCRFDSIPTPFSLASTATD